MKKQFIEKTIYRKEEVIFKLHIEDLTFRIYNIQNTLRTQLNSQKKKQKPNK